MAGEVPDFFRLGKRTAVARDIVRRNEYAAIKHDNITLRLDVIAGSICRGPVILEHRITGVSELKAKIPALRHFVNLCQTGRMSKWHEPDDARLQRLILALRVLDALDEGVSHRTIALVLLTNGKNLEWPGPGESTRSFIRRLITLAKRMQRSGPCGVLNRQV